MSATIRAKFRCIEVTKRYSHTEQPNVHNGNAPEHDVFHYRVKLLPVYGDKKGSGVSCPENKEFYAATPCGDFALETVSERAAASFTPGQAYYVDFTPAEG